MTALSPSQLYAYASGAGLQAGRAVMAAAIAIAESGGNPNAVLHCVNGVRQSDSTGACPIGDTENSVGLWQINLNAHPQFKGWNLRDPATNAKAMAQVSNGGTNFSPWPTAKSGAYKQYVPTVENAVGKGITGVVGGLGFDPGGDIVGVTGKAGGVLNGGLSGIEAIGAFFASLGADIFNVTWWRRIGIGTLGVTLIVIGVIVILSKEATAIAGIKGPAKGTAGGAGEAAGGAAAGLAESA